MGLDMYLEKHTYISQYGGETLELEYPGIKPERVNYIQERIGYWRKANAIHAWFVENVQSGVDECQKCYVDKEQLRKLLSTVTRIQADHTLAPALLPTQNGFFFGGTEYEEGYYDDLEETRKIMEAALEEEDGEFYYQASW